MANGGYTAIGVFRKHLNENSKKSKYATVSINAADLASGAQKSMFEPKVKECLPEPSSEEEEEPITVDELTKMAGNLKIGKKPKQVAKVAADTEMRETPSIKVRSKGIQKRQCKKSKKMLTF